MKRSKGFREYLLKSLKNPVEAAEYINAVLRESDINLLLAALKDVAEAQGGMTRLAREAKLNRANLYQMLSNHGNPRVHSLENVLRIFGLRLAVMPGPHRANRAA